MINSLPVLAATLVFLGFGYLTLVRIIWKQHSDMPLFTGLSAALSNPARLVRDIGRSGFYISLPATSLLLFWGWGPALLWLLIFHLFADTIINSGHASNSAARGIDSLLQAADSSNNFMRPLVSCSWQILMVLLSAILVTQLSTMFDQQSGIFWVLACLLPASTILQFSHRLIPPTVNKIAAAVVVTLGLIMADTLGIAVYGSWLPLGQAVDWLVINNGTLFALALVLTAALLSANLSFNEHLAALSGHLVLAVSVLALCALLWLQPELDAPVQSSASRNPSQPPFNAISLLFFGSLLVVFVRFLTSREASIAEPGVVDKHFSHWHLVSLYQLVFSVLIVVILAAAMGIGAWKTHYLEWSWNLDLLHHFEIALTSLFEMASMQSDIGSMAHTVFMSALFCIALSLLIFSFSHLRLNDADAESAKDLWTAFRRSTFGHCIVIFALSSYFLSRGVPLTVWVVVGCLSWLLVTQFVTQLACGPHAASGGESRPRRLLSGLCLVLMTVGQVQMFRLLLWWAQQEYWIAALLAAVFMLAAGILWHAPARALLSHFSTDKDSRIFD